MIRLLPIALFLLFLIPNSSQANHFRGGEITWECLPNGSYVFYAKVYRDCRGPLFNYPTLPLEIFGNPLPRDQFSNTISSIILRPNSNALVRNNGGDITPIVDPSTCNPVGLAISCTSSDAGSTQEFPYKSDPIRLYGRVPATGWRFGLTTPCCRIRNSNLATIGNMLLQANLYPNPTNPLSPNSNGLCFDNSPRFIESPEYLFCVGQEAKMNFGAIDLDGDSLVYSWDRPYNIPFIAPQPVSYTNGFSFTNPTPDRSFDTLNIPANLNRKTGMVRFLVNSGVPSNSDYMLSVRVSTYRNGNLLSVLRREYPAFVRNCSSLSGSNANNNPIINPPFFTGTGFTYKDSVVAGNQVSFNLSVRDTNLFNNNAQNIRIDLTGQSLSNDLRTVNDCPLPNDTACASLLGIPLYDSSRSVYYYTATGSWNSIFSWSTDCSDLTANGSAKTHYFYVKAQDGMCPIPGRTIKAIEITVLPDPNNCQGSITSIDESKDQMVDFLIYPNPSNGQIFIERKETERLNMQLFDVRGKLIMERVLNSSTEVIGLPEAAGIYFLRLMKNDGQSSYHKLLRN